MIGREPSNHHNDGYLCIANIIGIIQRDLFKCIYPRLQFTVRPILSSSDESL